jgi:hypothetical protein
MNMLTFLSNLLSLLPFQVRYPIEDLVSKVCLEKLPGPLEGFDPKMFSERQEERLVAGIYPGFSLNMILFFSLGFLTYFLFPGLYIKPPIPFFLK